MIKMISIIFLIDLPVDVFLCHTALLQPVCVCMVGREKGRRENNMNE